MVKDAADLLDVRLQDPTSCKMKFDAFTQNNPSVKRFQHFAMLDSARYTKFFEARVKEGKIGEDEDMTQPQFHIWATQ
eukprot:1769046-Amphidinium_carterae.1